MPKFYCDYCDIYLTHSSTNGRKQHNLGRKHINNKIDYYKNVIKAPGFVAPLQFDSEFNVIGHLGNIRQFIQNNTHQSYDKHPNNEKKLLNTEKDREMNKQRNNKQYSNLNYNLNEKNQNNKSFQMGTNNSNNNYKSETQYNFINKGTRNIKKGNNQYYNDRY